MLSDNSGYFVIQSYHNINDDIPHVLKYSFSSPTNQHYKLDNTFVHAYGTLMISDTELFWITRIGTSPFNAVFLKLTFANTSADWAKQMSCSSSLCEIYDSESILSTEKSKIYSLFGYASSSFNIYFSWFKTSDGTVVGNRYQSATSWSGSPTVYGLVLNGYNIVGTLQCSSTYLVIYNIPSDSFTFNSFSSDTYLYDVATESRSNR